MGEVDVPAAQQFFQRVENSLIFTLRHIEAHECRSRLAYTEDIAGGMNDFIVQAVKRDLCGILPIR